MEPDELLKKINRVRCLTLFAQLRGCYNKFCSAYAVVKTGPGQCEYASPVAKEAWDRANMADVERLCGQWYTEGVNPDSLPHPVQVALQLKYGRDISVAMAMLGKSDFIPKVQARCATIGIRL